jgi:hypothetical protein
MNTTEIFLIAMTIIFTVPYLIWRLGRTDYCRAAGGGADHHRHPARARRAGRGVSRLLRSSSSTRPSSTALNGVAWWAVMLFVMIAGIELDLQARPGNTAAKAASPPGWRWARRCCSAAVAAG